MPGVIALFGGAFDPPHMGHVFAAVYARFVHQAEQVWVLPTMRHPWGKSSRPFAQRMALCQRAFADLPFVQVRGDEADNPSGTTWDLLELLLSRFPHQSFALVGGTDTGRDLPKWYRGQELAQRLPIFVVPRRPADAPGDPGALPAISSTLVRNRLAAGHSLDGLLPAAVLSALVNEVQANEIPAPPNPPDLSCPIPESSPCP